MKKVTVVGVTGVVIFVLLGAGALLAQRNRVRVEQGPRTMVFNIEDGHSHLGVRLKDVTADNLQELKLSSESGAIVSEVEDGSPAAKAGLQVNDVIVEFDGERVRSVAQLRRMVQDTPEGRTVAVKISRGGKIQTLNVKLEGESAEQQVQPMEMPEVVVPDVHIPEMNFDFFNAGPRLGISADDLTPQLAEHLGVTAGKGVLVLEVTPGSAGEKAGLKAGDCIVKVGTDSIDSVSELQRALRRSASPEEKKTVSLTIVRDKHEQTLSAELEPSHRMRMTMPRRIAGEDNITLDSSELINLKENLRSSLLALQSAQRELNGQRLKLMQDQQRMMRQLRRELQQKRFDTTALEVD